MAFTSLQITPNHDPFGLGVIEHLDIPEAVLNEMAVMAELVLGFRRVVVTGDYAEMARLAVAQAVLDWAEQTREGRMYAEVWRGSRKWKVTDVVAQLGISAKAKALADQVIAAAELAGAVADGSTEYQTLISL